MAEIIEPITPPISVFMSLIRPIKKMPFIKNLPTNVNKRSLYFFAGVSPKRFADGLVYSITRLRLKTRRLPVTVFSTSEILIVPAQVE